MKNSKEKWEKIGDWVICKIQISLTFYTDETSFYLDDDEYWISTHRNLSKSQYKNGGGVLSASVAMVGVQE